MPITAHTQSGTHRQNIWGLDGGLEAQRADLWLLDLSAVCRHLRTLDPRAVPAVDLTQLPKEDSLAAYARQVSFPAAQTKVKPFTVGTVPRNMPGYLTELEQVRIEFIHDAPGESLPSAVMTVLSAWAGLARTGRDGGLPTGKLLSSSYKPIYRFNVPILLLQGSALGDRLVPSSSYILERAWLAGIQIGELNQESGSQVQRITASAYCSWITRTAVTDDALMAAPVEQAAGPTIILTPTLGYALSKSRQARLDELGVLFGAAYEERTASYSDYSPEGEDRRKAAEIGVRRIVDQTNYLSDVNPVTGKYVNPY